MNPRWPPVVAAFVLLDVSLTFENVWPTPAVRWFGQLSIELAACVAALALATQLRGSTVSRGVVAALSVVWSVLVLGRYADVTAPALYGRDVNLYWDLRFVPDVAAMITRVAPIWLVAVSVLTGALVLAALFGVVWWAWRQIGRAMVDRRKRLALTCTAVLMIVLFAWEKKEGRLFGAKATVVALDQYIEPAPPIFPSPVTATYLRQVRFVVDALSGSSALPPTPPMRSDFSRVKGADVFVVFIESYGAISYERPAIASALADTRSALEAAIRDTNREVVSAFVESPTFGGSSWLAHVSLLSGIEVRDPETNARLLTEHRDTLVRAFSRGGFRTIGLMPGLRQRWPEGVFYGFDEIYGADRLAYHGPEFGWFAVPDQFSLSAIDALELSRPARPPLFVFFPTISTHFPFRPTPPYQPDWSRMSQPQPYDGPDIVRAYAREPDWTHFAPGYAEAMAYDFACIAGFLRLHPDRDLVMILLGDHQPPAAVTGEGASWNVPVHIVASRPDVLDRLSSSGFRRGLAPGRSAIARMHALGPILLDAFGVADGQKPADIVRSEVTP